jgi:hypothetical protein
MRWEYRTPEEQLFVADGSESFLYVPSDRQVTIQPLGAADLHGTPLSFLLGSEDINRSFFVAHETEFKPKMEGTLLIRLVPRRQQSEFAFLVLELDQKSYDLRRIVIREPGGSTTEFILTNVVMNTTIDKKLFEFKTPKAKEGAAMLAKLDAAKAKRVLVLVEKIGGDIERALGNIGNVGLGVASCATTYDILSANRVIITKGGLKGLIERVKG